MEEDNRDILSRVADYYSQKLAEHGETPRGVDWNSEEGQTLRLEQLSKVIGSEQHFSINDLGCGLGAYFEYLSRKFNDIRYQGFDLSSDMIQVAKRRFADHPRAHFAVAGVPNTIADYGVASGIFNVRLDSSNDAWLEHIKQTLDALNMTSRLGFAFNCLTTYSDPHLMREYLYYADPGRIFDHCKRNFSRNVALLHDYGLYEFTVLVRKT